MTAETSAPSEFLAETPHDLIRTQYVAVRKIVAGILDIAVAERTKRKSATEPKLDETESQASANSTTEFDRPHQVFTIDGARGAGKTYVLLTVTNAMRLLSDTHEKGSDKEKRTKNWAKFAGKPLPQVDETSPTKIAHVIRLIIPSDMEREESVMQRIFAAMKQEVDARLRLETLDYQEQEKLVALRDHFDFEVIPGWHFSKAGGQDVVRRDAVNFNDYPALYEREAEKSARRIETWRDFLERFLNCFDTDLLVICMDDSDVHPDIVDDILRSIRMYLNHPRVVTILAGNIRAMRALLLHRAMSSVAKAMKALGDKTGQTAADWRRTERRAIEDYLEKVLPQTQRFFVKPLFAGADDFKKIAGSSLDEISQKALRYRRTRSLNHKFSLATRYANPTVQADRPDLAARRTIEEFMAWWVFRNQYKDALAPRSARQIKTFADYYKNHGSKEDWKATRERRVIMVLLENPANFSLIQQFSDQDINVSTWLQDQHIDSEWVGPRRFHLNGRALDRGQFTYDYIRYRLDVGLAMPIRHNAEEALPLNLLPVPHGRTHLRRFFHPYSMPRRLRRLGVCQWIDHAVIPGNCIYLRDLDALPDRSLLHGKVSGLRKDRVEVPLVEQIDRTRRGLGQGYWEKWLSRNWIDVIADYQDEMTYRYFADVVCASQGYLEDTDTSQMLRLLDPPSLVQERQEGIYEFFWREEFSRFAYDKYLGDKQTQLAFKTRTWEEFLKLGRTERQDLFARMGFVFGASESDRAAALKISEETLKNVARNKETAEKDAELVKELWESQPGAPKADQLRDMFDRFERIRARDLALYAAIINDVRRAWHAIRIYDLSLGALGRAGGAGRQTVGHGDERVSFAVLAAQDRLSLYTAEDIRKQFQGNDWTRWLLVTCSSRRVLWALTETLRSCTPGGSSFDEERATNAKLSDLVEDAGVAAEAFEGQVGSYGTDGAVGTLLELKSFWSFVGTESETRGRNAADDKKREKGGPEDDEKTDFRKWTKALRAVGRVMCKQWPDLGDHDPALPLSDSGSNCVFDKFEAARVAVEDWLQHHERQGEAQRNQHPFDLRVLRDKNSPREDKGGEEGKSRSARNFMLLLYGLAPSLPSLLHCHLMGILREAELNFQAVMKAPNEQATEYKQVREYAKKTFEKVGEQLDAWAELILTLAIALRYVRVRYLHLHMALWIEMHGAPGASDDRSKSNIKETDNFLRAIFGDRVGFADLHGKLRELFLPHDQHAARDLAIMPDFAPSTVFGDRWLEDTLVSLARSGKLGDSIDLQSIKSKEPGEMPQIVDGVCPETEQWLWATMRCLKKFHKESKDVLRCRLDELDRTEK